MLAILKPTLLFLLAGVCEIGGGYLIWQWLRAGQPLWQGLAGAALLVLYGIVATRQELSFGKTYAVYGACLFSCRWPGRSILTASGPTSRT